ncbi:HCCA isomerase/glutathione S-transferase kappa [Penicillium brevicompactum]|uniref:Glutathione S-transferase kappa n=1 Tax=Penicillium brevicompactum TaxID=5074 RepID=A0A9W9RM73_PENBR|nr:HCCA isomerase/glutathione S-transferase kappa [Penicillium brevicompactum]
MAPPKITFYVDIVSPFAYIAFHVLRNSPAFANCEVTYVPIFLGGLMQALSKPQANSCYPVQLTPPDKKNYLGQQRVRWAKYFSVPIIEGFPKGFPIRTLPVQRALCAISQRNPEKLADVIGAIFHSFWVDGNTTVGDAEGFAPLVESVLGPQETQEVIAAMGKPEIKALLSANTDRSFASGAFGLPWFECTNSKGEKEGFWGVDHIGQVADFLDLDRSLDKGFRAAL